MGMQAMRSRFAVATVALTWALTWGPSAALAESAPDYRTVDLGTLGGTLSEATGVNERAEVVGYAQTAVATHPFLWRQGSMTDLGVLEAGAGEYGAALGVNDSGQVVGYGMVDAGRAAHAFLWEHGTLRDLGTLGGKDSFAYGINNGGQIVGVSSTADGEQHAFLWQHGTMADLGAGGAYEINDMGQIVGFILAGASIYHACLWWRAGHTDLDPSNPSFSEAVGINYQGWAVGDAIRSGNKHAYMWRHHRMIDLGTLGGDNSYAVDVNDQGQVLGESETGSGDSEHGFLWQDGTLVDLTRRGISPDVSLHDVNDRGDIVGTVRTGDDFHAALYEH
jgi:probable HAF family extracellular repeat protein